MARKMLHTDRKFSPCGSRMTNWRSAMHEGIEIAVKRKELANRYGFGTFADMMAASHRLPKQTGDKVEIYLARSPQGRWFAWEDVAHKSLVDGAVYVGDATNAPTHQDTTAPSAPRQST